MPNFYSNPNTLSFDQLVAYDQIVSSCDNFVQSLAHRSQVAVIPYSPHVKPLDFNHFHSLDQAQIRLEFAQEESLRILNAIDYFSQFNLTDVLLAIEAYPGRQILELELNPVQIPRLSVRGLIPPSMAVTLRDFTKTLDATPEFDFKQQFAVQSRRLTPSPDVINQLRAILPDTPFRLRATVSGRNNPELFEILAVILQTDFHARYSYLGFKAWYKSLETVQICQKWLGPEACLLNVLGRIAFPRGQAEVVVISTPVGFRLGMNFRTPYPSIPRELRVLPDRLQIDMENPTDCSHFRFIDYNGRPRECNNSWKPFWTLMRMNS